MIAKVADVIVRGGAGAPRWDAGVTIIDKTLACNIFRLVTPEPHVTDVTVGGPKEPMPCLCFGTTEFRSEQTPPRGELPSRTLDAADFRPVFRPKVLDFSDLFLSEIIEKVANY